jgi:hypothetical protein
MGYSLLRQVDGIPRENKRTATTLSTFESITEQSRLDGEIFAADFIAERIVNRLRSHNYSDSDIMYYAILGYLGELKELKNDE